MSSINDKIAQLRHCTEQAKQEMEQKERELRDSQERLDVARELLQSMDPKDQETIPIADTPYPELLGMHQLAKDAHETARKRYETNQRYLEKLLAAQATP
jgi:hypothetical protein